MSTYKTKSLLLVLILTVLTLSACGEKDPLKVERTDNAEFSVGLLFVHEGIKVYRFKDNGRFIYYTDARGATFWNTTRQSGKTRVLENHEVNTER